MKKISLLFKEASENRIKHSLKESSSIFIVNYPKISSSDLSALRQSLKDANASLFVAKNSVARRALEDAGLEVLVKKIEGPCGLVFTKDDPAGASRVLYNFFKEHEQLKLEGGYLKDRVLERNDIEALAKLPPKQILRAQVVMTLNSPISGLVISLNQIMAKFVWCLEEIKKKKPS